MSRVRKREERAVPEPMPGAERGEVPWGEYSRMAACLWWTGFANACALQRCVLFFLRSRVILVKTAQCFALNGCLFLGSIFFLQYVMSPSLRWVLLPSDVNSNNGGEFSSPLHSFLVSLYKFCWLYPLYVASFFINSMWYKEIAKHAFKAMEAGSFSSGLATGAASQSAHSGDSDSVPSTATPGASTRVSRGQTPVERMVKDAGEQIFAVLMVSFFCAQVFLVGYVPVVGPALSFILLSWLYAYYCFDYRWSFACWSLDKRLRFFESKWAFFAGFGTPCVLCTFFLSTLLSAGVLALLFPLFVLVATATDPDRAVIAAAGSERAAAKVGRIPIFRPANAMTLALIKLFQPRTTTRMKGQHTK